MKVTFTCTDYALPKTCNECDHLTDASCLSSGNQIYQIANRHVLICNIFAISMIGLFFGWENWLYTKNVYLNNSEWAYVCIRIFDI